MAMELLHFSVKVNESCLALVLIKALFSLILVVGLVESATTTPAATTLSTTVDAGAGTTTQAQTNAPILPPLVPNQDRTTVGETVVGQCLCDLTGSECDINCCCDEDCTDTDKATFNCDPTSVIIDNKVCYQEQVFLFTSSPAKTTVEDGGLFCIYFDNYAERNFYLDPNFVQDPLTFTDYIDTYGKISLSGKPVYMEPEFTFDSFYKFGDPIYIIYPNEARGDMVLPAPLVSNQCIDQNSMAFLREETTECVRLVTNLQTQCETLSTLSYAAYALGFKIVKTPGLFGYVENGTLIEITTAATAAPPTTPTPTTAAGATKPTTITPAPTTQPSTSGVNPSVVQTLYDNPYTIEIDYASQTHQCIQADGSLVDCALANATYAGATCSNVVKEVRYTVITNGLSGIDSMNVRFVLTDITAADLPHTQKYSVAYRSVTDNNVTESRSGNPGYMVGKPLLYGTLNASTDAQGVTTQQIVRELDPTRGLTVMSSGVVVSPLTGAPTVACSLAQSTRIPLRFGEDMRTGCTIQLNLTGLASATNNDVCIAIQNNILQAFEGNNLPVFDGQNNVWVDNNRYVATFGNTATDKVGDWVKIIVDNRPIPNTKENLPKDTCRLSLGLHIQVLYASVGALADPQSKILGVALLYDNIKDVKFRCVGGFCQDANQDLIQNFEVSQSVSYVDASQPAIKFKGEAPIFIAKVPNDFFYPFLYYTSGARHIKTVHKSFVVILSLLVTVCFNVKSLIG